LLSLNSLTASRWCANPAASPPEPLIGESLVPPDRRQCRSQPRQSIYGWRKGQNGRRPIPGRQAAAWSSLSVELMPGAYLRPRSFQQSSATSPWPLLGGAPSTECQQQFASAARLLPDTALKPLRAQLQRWVHAGGSGRKSVRFAHPCNITTSGSGALAAADVVHHPARWRQPCTDKLKCFLPASGRSASRSATAGWAGTATRPTAWLDGFYTTRSFTGFSALTIFRVAGQRTALATLAEFCHLTCGAGRCRQQAFQSWLDPVPAGPPTRRRFAEKPEAGQTLSLGILAL
jgi:hypothetical protein